MDALTQHLHADLTAKTSAGDRACWAVARRISSEVQRICTESNRIQSSGEVDTWARSLANHRIEQCLRYYRLGSKQGRVELHSTLSAIVYRYITPTQVQTRYQARINLIEDFLQGFYVEALGAFRRENHLTEFYQPRILIDLAEFMAFAERYAKRRIPLPGNRSQQLIILRAQTFSKQQPPKSPSISPRLPTTTGMAMILVRRLPISGCGKK